MAKRTALIGVDDDEHFTGELIDVDNKWYIFDVGGGKFIRFRVNTDEKVLKALDKYHKTHNFNLSELRCYKSNMDLLSIDNDHLTPYLMSDKDVKPTKKLTQLLEAVAGSRQYVTMKNPSGKRHVMSTAGINKNISHRSICYGITIDNSERVKDTFNMLRSVKPLNEIIMDGGMCGNCQNKF